MGFLGRYTEPIYALLRIVTGFLFACHGAQKLFGALGGQKVPPGPTLMFLAGVIELVAGVLIMVGLSGLVTSAPAHLSGAALEGRSLVERYGIHWSDVDEDISTEGLLRGTPAPRARGGN